MVTVKEIMTKNVLTVSKKTTIEETALLMKTNGVGSLLVKEEDDIVGIVTETDIVHKVVAARKNPKDTSIELVMSFPLMTIEADTGVEQAGEYMVENGIRHLAVTENEKVAGLLSMRDLLSLYYSRGERPGS